MPDRIIRDELLRSHRYRTLSSDTLRLLFLHLLLAVDNFGNCEANTIITGDVLGRPIDETEGAVLLAELADKDLIRLYWVDEKSYLHIPRFRQRMRYLNSKHPRPPENIECKEINKMLEKVRPKSGEAATKSAEVKRSEEKRSEVVLPQVVVTPTVTRATPPAEPEGDKSPAKGNTGKQWWRSEEGIAAKAKELCEQARPGETFVDLKRRLFDVIAGRERQATA